MPENPDAGTASTRSTAARCSAPGKPMTLTGHGAAYVCVCKRDRQAATCANGRSVDQTQRTSQVLSREVAGSCLRQTDDGGRTRGLGDNARGRCAGARPGRTSALHGEPRHMLSPSVRAGRALRPVLCNRWPHVVDQQKRLELARRCGGRPVRPVHVVRGDLHRRGGRRTARGRTWPTGRGRMGTGSTVRFRRASATSPASRSV